MSELPMDDRIKELIKAALREVLDERDEALGVALPGYDTGEGADGLLPPGPYEDLADLDMLEEQADELLDELAESSRRFLVALERYRAERPVVPATDVRARSGPVDDPASELHNHVMDLEAAAQDAHDAIDDLLDATEFEEVGEDDGANDLN